jgi:hypothetical protein
MLFRKGILRTFKMGGSWRIIEQEIVDEFQGLVNGAHHSLLFAKACPEPDFRYCSNSAAFDFSENAM